MAELVTEELHKLWTPPTPRAQSCSSPSPRACCVTCAPPRCRRSRWCNSSAISSRATLWSPPRVSARSPRTRKRSGPAERLLLGRGLPLPPPTWSEAHRASLAVLDATAERVPAPAPAARDLPLGNALADAIPAGTRSRQAHHRRPRLRRPREQLWCRRLTPQRRGPGGSQRRDIGASQHDRISTKPGVARAALGGPTGVGAGGSRGGVSPPVTALTAVLILRISQ